MESTTTTILQNEIVSRAVSRKLKLQLQCLCVCVCDSISRKCSNKDEMRTTKHNKIRSNEMYLCDVWVCVVCCVRNGGLHTKCINTTVADWAAVACRVHTTERYGRLVVCLCVCLSPQQHAALIRGAQNNNNNNTKDDDRKKKLPMCPATWSMSECVSWCRLSSICSTHSHLTSHSLQSLAIKYRKKKYKFLSIFTNDRCVVDHAKMYATIVFLHRCHTQPLPFLFVVVIRAYLSAIFART